MFGSKLDNMKKPSKRRAEEEFNMDGLDGESSELAGESEGEHGREPESGDMVAPNPELEAASDDELLAELKRRGLMGAVDKMSSGKANSDDEYMG